MEHNHDPDYDPNTDPMENTEALKALSAALVLGIISVIIAGLWEWVPRWWDMLTQW